MGETKWYFHNVSSTIGPTDEQTSWTADVNANGYDTPRQMTATKGSSQVSQDAALSGSGYGYYRVFVSPPLAAQLVNAQTVQIAIGGKSTIDGSTYFGWGVYVWRSGSNVATIVSNNWDDYTFDISEKGKVDTSSSTQVSLIHNDRICVEVWMQSDPASTATFYYDGATEPTEGVPTSDAASYMCFTTQELKSARGLAGIVALL